jgi:hypothetical protein
MIFRLFRSGLKLNDIGSFRGKNCFLFNNKIKNFNKPLKNLTKYNSTITTAAANAAVRSSKSSNKVIGIWLAGCAGMVSGAVF